MTPILDPPRLHDFLAAQFPQMAGRLQVTALTPEGLEAVMPVTGDDLRPGGTVSGPTLFALADVAMYLALLSRIGPEALAVTTGASIDFMRKPAAGADLRAEVRLLKLGRVLAVGDVLIRSGTDPAPVARAALTYSIPPAR